MAGAALAGLAYVAVVFSAGFLLGTLRVLVVIPAIGVLAAVMLEVPMILGVSWLACRYLVRRMAVPATAGARALMGAVAFLVLMLAEYALASFGFGRSLADHLASYRDPAALLGLAAQLGFALLPLLDMRTGESPRR